MAAAGMGLRAIWRPGYALIKAGVMLVELQPDTVMQAELDFGANDMPVGRAKLAGAVDALNDRFGRGTVVLASEGLSSTPRAWEMKQQRRTPYCTTRWQDLPVARA